jgi:hypothetical protein
MNINDVISKLFFDVHVQTTFVLTSTFPSNFGLSLHLKEYIAYTLLNIWGNLHIPNARMGTLSWFAHFGTRVCYGAQLLSCSML